MNSKIVEACSRLNNTLNFSFGICLRGRGGAKFSQLRSNQSQNSSWPRRRSLIGKKSLLDSLVLSLSFSSSYAISLSSAEVIDSYSLFSSRISSILLSSSDIKVASNFLLHFSYACPYFFLTVNSQAIVIIMIRSCCFL